MTSKVSNAVVFKAPVIMIAAHLCMDASLFTMAQVLWLSFACFPTFCCGVRKTSAAYNMWGTAMERYSCHVYFTLIPCDARASLLNWISQSCPLASAAAHCPFQFSLLSMTTPRNLAVSFDGMRWLPNTRAQRGICTLLFGFIWCGTSFLEISRSWNFLIPNSQLWFFAHSKIPPGWFMMFHSFL